MPTFMFAKFAKCDMKLRKNKWFYKTIFFKYFITTIAGLLKQKSSFQKDTEVFFS